MWVAALVVLVGLAAAALMLDLRNRDRFLLVCDDGTMSLHRGRRFPWPLGHVPAGGPNLDPVALSSTTRCHEREFDSQTSAEQAFLERLLVQVEAALDRPGGKVGEGLRKQVSQAVGLSRRHTEYRDQARGLSAAVSYREARQSLARVEDELRAALARFREVKTFGGLGHGDVDRWIEHLESLLKAVAPVPGPKPTGTSIDKLMKTLEFPPSGVTDAGATATPDADAPVKATPDAAPPPPPDAGSPSNPGILM